MFTRSLFDYDMIGQQRLLARTADLVDRGLITTTVTKTISGLDAEGIREAHRDVETGRTIGKVVVCRQ